MLPGSLSGGGLIKIEVWEDEDGVVVKYSFAYINHLLCSKDNGRVIGYDNVHTYHHKHYFGEIFSVDDFTEYQLVRIFREPNPGHGMRKVIESAFADESIQVIAEF